MYNHLALLVVAAGRLLAVERMTSGAPLKGENLEPNFLKNATILHQNVTRSKTNRDVIFNWAN